MQSREPQNVGQPSEPKRQDSLGRLPVSLLRRTSGPLLGLILLCVGFSFSSEYFLSFRNALNILDQITVLGILALGMTSVIIIGGIDLSVGSVLAFSMMTMGWLSREMSMPLGLAIVCGMATGALCGLACGLLIIKAKLPPFIATLTMMSIARGLANILTDGRQVVGYPDWFTEMATTRHFGFLSLTMVLFLVLSLWCWVYLAYRPNGRNLYAIGGNSEVARLAGIKVQQLTISVYVLSGLMAGIAAMALAARLDSSQPSAGLTYELNTIAAVVIGGASLNGGVGSIGGTVLGVLIIGVLRNGLNLVGVSPFVQQIVIGVVIAIAVSFDTLGRKKS